MKKIKPLAIYLPQFHPTVENDEWWGKGFTEWTNVTKAKPLFRGHNQPQLPTDLGFYDLRLIETQKEQVKLAKEYGIAGFAYYHYWFEGKRLINAPIDNLLLNKDVDFPFCLFWANETWSRRWLGEEKEILIKQTYSAEDDINHIHWLINVFKDSRYIKVNNRPVLIIYRPLDFPDIRATLKTFSEECVKVGLERPYFISSNSHIGNYDIRELGFDAILNFEPQLGCLPEFNSDEHSFRKLRRNIKQRVLNSKLKLYDYKYAKERMISRKFNYPFFPCCLVNWDNTARRGNNGIVFKNSSPAIFGEYLEKSIEQLRNMNFESEDENLLFINAWNEWAEGNHLEPCSKYGRAYLEALKNTLIRTGNL